MSIYRPVEEVVAKLADRSFAEPHVIKVNKGSKERPRWLPVIEWHENLRMLDVVFGPFGYDLRIVGSTSDYANGLYTVDMELTGRAVTETGEVVSLTRAGRGLGLVPRSAINSDAEHDRQAHGAKSDAITNAAKALGDGFGLFLYPSKRAEGEAASDPSPAQPTPATRPAAKPTPKNSNYVPDPSKGISEAQINLLVKNGATRAEVEGLNQAEASAAIDAMKANGWKFVRGIGKSSSTVTPADFETDGKDEVNF